jgi:hypothetical protein
VQAAWWQEKQDEVVDRSWCRVAAHNRSLHAGFAAVHHKTSQVTWLNHKTKTGGSADGDEIRLCQEASMPAGTWRDHRACIGRTRAVEKAWPCDEEKYYMTYLPLRGLYLNLCNRGSFIFRLPPYKHRGERMAAISRNPSSFPFAILATYFP